MMLMLVHPGACLLLHNWSTDWHAGPRRSTFLSLSDQIAIWDSTVLCLVEDLHSMTVLECWIAGVLECLHITTVLKCSWRSSACLSASYTFLRIKTQSISSELPFRNRHHHNHRHLQYIYALEMNMNIKDFDPNTQCRGISMSHYLYFYLPSLKSDLCLQSSRMGAPLWVTWFSAIIFQSKVPANWRLGLNV